MNDQFFLHDQEFEELEMKKTEIENKMKNKTEKNLTMLYSIIESISERTDIYSAVFSQSIIKLSICLSLYIHQIAIRIEISSIEISS